MYLSRASWKAQVAFNAPRDFQSCSDMCLTLLSSYTGATQRNWQADTPLSFGNCTLESSLLFGIMKRQATNRVEVQPLNTVIHTQL